MELEGSRLATVVMPVRNEERHVAESIASVLGQSYQDIEVLVVDGRSDDATAAIVTEIAANDRRVHLLDNPHRMIPHALNVGLRAAHGEFLVRIDAHAWVNSTYIERGVSELLSRSDLAAVGGRRIGVSKARTGKAVAAALSSPFGVGDSINHFATTKQDTDHASFGVYRMQALQDVGGWDEALPVNEDVDIDHRLIARGHSIEYDPDMRIYWQVRDTLFDLCRQYRRYGRGKAAMVRKNGRTAVRPRHLAAPALVVSLTAAGSLAAAGHRRIPTVVVGGYAAAVAAATGLAMRGRDADASVPPLVLAAAFVAMHTSWGLGFLEGILLRLSPVASSARTG